MPDGRSEVALAVIDPHAYVDAIRRRNMQPRQRVLNGRCWMEWAMDGSVAMVRHKTMKASRDEAEVNVCRRLRQQQQVGSVAARLWNAWAANTVRVVHEYVCAGLQILASRVCDAVRGIAGAGDRVEWKVASVAHCTARYRPQ